MSDRPGQLFRTAWINGVNRHYPGDPKPGYVAPWHEMPAWEQSAAQAVYEQVRDFIRISDGATAHLSPEQRGQFIAACWNAQVHKHIAEPKPSYVAPWDELPQWQRAVDIDLFTEIEKFEQTTE